MPWWYWVIIFAGATMVAIPWLLFRDAVDRYVRREAKRTEEEKEKRRARNERLEIVNAYVVGAAVIVWLAISFLGELIPGSESGGRAKAAEAAVGSQLSAVLGLDDPDT